MTTVSAALVTQNCPVGKFNDNLAHTLELARTAAGQQAKIVLFPEMNLTGYATDHEVLDISMPLTDQVINPIAACAKENNITILAGLAEKDIKNRIYATHLVVSPDGIVQTYRKTHTAPFEKKFFSCGNEIPIFQFDTFKFGIQLCYDAHFPELSLAMALKGADVIFIPHASPRGNCREKYDSWLRHLTARAFDNGVYIAACNQTGKNERGLSFPGISLLIGPDGNVASRLMNGRSKIHLVSLDLAFLDSIRSHKMRYFLPNRRSDLFGNLNADPIL